MEGVAEDGARPLERYTDSNMVAKKRNQPDEMPLAERRQLNVRIRKDVVLKAKTHCIYQEISLPKFVERAILKALTSVEKPETT